MIIIRIYKFSSVADPSGGTSKFSAFLISDEEKVCIAPAHESLAYVAAIASLVRDILIPKTTEHIKIEYPYLFEENTAPAVEKNPAFESKAKYDVPMKKELSMEEVLWEEIIHPKGSPLKTSRQRSREGLPFDSRGTMSGIRLQARNVAERANLGDYSSFVGEIVRLGETLQEDLEARYDDEKAREERHAKFHARLQRTYSVGELGVLLEQLGSAGFVQKITDLVNGQ